MNIYLGQSSGVNRTTKVTFSPTRKITQSAKCDEQMLQFEQVVLLICDLSSRDFQVVSSITGQRLLCQQSNTLILCDVRAVLDHTHKCWYPRRLTNRLWHSWLSRYCVVILCLLHRFHRRKPCTWFMSQSWHQCQTSCSDSLTQADSNPTLFGLIETGRQAGITGTFARQLFETPHIICCSSLSDAFPLRCYFSIFPLSLSVPRFFQTPTSQQWVSALGI